MQYLIFAGATEQLAALNRGELSSEELVGAFLDRIEAVNPLLNAVIRLRAEAALRDARAADAGGRPRTRPLLGLPFTIKDSFDTAGLISTAGTPGRADYVPAQNATVVDRLLRAGAILLGKTNTPELTLSYETENLLFGRTLNPYDPSKSPGGSSGGAAVAVASGCSAFDIGSDTGGSIRQPAHFCGIAGLKPTHGRVSRFGHIIGPTGHLNPLTQIGPLARRVADLKLLLPILQGIDWRDSSIVPAPRISTTSRTRRMRICWFADNGVCPPDDPTQHCIAETVSALKDAGHHLVENMPGELRDAFELYYALFKADGSQWVRDLLAQWGTADPHPMLAWAKAGEGNDTAGAFARTLSRWDAFRAGALQIWEKWDALICPVNASASLPAGSAHAKENRLGFSYTVPFNLTGWPVLVVRAGVAPDGAPVGVQIVGAPFREDVVFKLAEAVEEAGGGFRPPPLSPLLPGPTPSRA